MSCKEVSGGWAKSSDSDTGYDYKLDLDKGKQFIYAELDATISTTRVHQIESEDLEEG